MTAALQDLIARRDALLAELKAVRADIKRAKPPPNRDKLNQIQATAREKQQEAIAMRRNGMSYRAIAEKIDRSASRVRTIIVRAERREQRERQITC